MKFKDHKDFFEQTEGYVLIAKTWAEDEIKITVEELYQFFAARMAEEKDQT